MASIVHSGNSNQQVKRRVKTSAGIVEHMVSIPDAIYRCNKQMGGVNLRSAPTILPDKVPEPQVLHDALYQCIDIAIANAYITYRESLTESQRTQCDHKKIIAELVRETLEASTATPISPSVGRPSRSPVRAQHRPAHVDKRKYWVMCKYEKKYKLTDKQCVQCKVFLCFTNNRDCFAEWHHPLNNQIHDKYTTTY